MKNNKQKGMTLIGLLLVLIIAGFFAMMIVKVAPLYMKQFAVADVMETVSNKAGVGKMSSAQIKALISKNMSINGVENFDGSVISFKRNGSVRTMRVNYEDRTGLFGRLNAALVFDQEVTIK